MSLWLEKDGLKELSNKGTLPVIFLLIFILSFQINFIEFNLYELIFIDINLINNDIIIDDVYCISIIY